MTSPLERLAGTGGSLQAEPSDEREIAGLKRSAIARLTDARNDSNSLEGRFDLVYNAAHALSLAALRHSGFRSKNRYVVFRYCLTRLVLGQRFGACLQRAIKFVTARNMKASWTSTSDSWRI